MWVWGIAKIFQTYHLFFSYYDLQNVVSHDQGTFKGPNLTPLTTYLGVGGKTSNYVQSTLDSPNYMSQNVFNNSWLFKS